MHNTIFSQPSLLSRRQFLQRSGLLIGGLGLGLGFAGCGSSSDAVFPDQGAAMMEPSWETLRAQLSGPLLRPGDADFVALATPWNQRYIGTYPAGIARCRTVGDVQASLAWAQVNGVPMVVKSGGHSYGGYSLTRGLMLDISQMNDVSYDEPTGIATVAGGARNSTVYAALRSRNAAITHGRCRGVGVGGLVLGGGVGFNMRLHGLTCDQLIETEIVTASGQVLTCNKDQNADIFWACQGGGGGNFGVNTSFKFQTFPVSELVTYRISWNDPVDRLLPTALAFLPETTNRLGIKLNVNALSGQPLRFVLLGQLLGTVEELREILAPLYALALPAEESIQVLPYWDAQELLSEDGVPEYAKERSRYIYRPMTAEGCRTITGFLRAWPGTSVAATWKIFLTGGKVDELSRTSTAYVHRGAIMLSSVDVEWDGKVDSLALVERNLAWVNEFHDAMEPFTSSECYQNFIDPAQANYLQAYYAENLSRLIAVKGAIDPTDLFRFPQSLPEPA